MALSSSIFVLGAGGLAKVLIEALLKSDKTIIGNVVHCADKNFLMLSSVMVYYTVCVKMSPEYICKQQALNEGTKKW